MFCSVDSCFYFKEGCDKIYDACCIYDNIIHMKNSVFMQIMSNEAIILPADLYFNGKMQSSGETELIWLARLQRVSRQRWISQYLVKKTFTFHGK